MIGSLRVSLVERIDFNIFKDCNGIDWWFKEREHTYRCVSQPITAFKSWDNTKHIWLHDDEIEKYIQVILENNNGT